MIELTTMCAVIQQDKVLMIDRIYDWKGWTFPGGHLIKGESFTDCAIREIKEETGLRLRKVKYKGIAHFFNTKSKNMHIITNFICKEYEGIIKNECDEGKIDWIDINNILNINLAEGMQYRIPLFFENGIKELYVKWDETNGYTDIKYNNL